MTCNLWTLAHDPDLIRVLSRLVLLNSQPSSSQRQRYIGFWLLKSKPTFLQSTVLPSSSWRKLHQERKSLSRVILLSTSQFLTSKDWPWKTFWSTQSSIRGSLNTFHLLKRLLNYQGSLSLTWSTLMLVNRLQNGCQRGLRRGTRGSKTNRISWSRWIPM